jgi:glycosyltransferase involved in cell wall biosynthesis
VVVVPCFNEERRLDERAFTDLAATGRVRLLFVDDGSTDATAAVLARMSADDGIEVFTLGANAGKAEAVRRGLLVAVRGGAGLVGYYDADLATPPGELLRQVATLEDRPELTGVLGSRVARLGSSIERHALRHYLGRSYATLASWALGFTVYDTQCGAKVFRVGETFAAALAEPFRSSWAFDVELLDRLVRGFGGAAPVPPTAFVEVPLGSWRDVSGSKLRLGSALRALRDLVAMGIRHRRTRPVRTPGPSATAPAAVMVPRPPGAPPRTTAGRDHRRRRA